MRILLSEMYRQHKHIPPNAICVLCSDYVTNNNGFILWGIPVHLNCVNQIADHMEQMEQYMDIDNDDPFGDDHDM